MAREQWTKNARDAFDKFMKAVRGDEPEPNEPPDSAPEAEDQENSTELWDELMGDEPPPVKPAPAAASTLKSKGTEMDKPNPPKTEEAFENQQKEYATMKAQMGALQLELDTTRHQGWFDEQLRAGKVVPAERADVLQALLQLTADDRAALPTMKAANGAPLSRVAVYQKAISDRQPTVNLDGMKAAGYRAQSQPQEETELTDAKRAELLAKSALGTKMLQEEKAHANGNGHK